MSNDEIIELAKGVVGNYEYASYWPFFTEELQHFAKLVAAKEREACADIAEKQRYAMHISLTSHPAQNGTAVGIANQIRTRGEA
jgi:hypothetical protein